MKFVLEIEMGHPESYEGFLLIDPALRLIREQVAPALESVGVPGDTGTVTSTDGTVIGKWEVVA